MHTVLYPVNELKIGGAEQQLLELVRGLDKRRFRPIVAPLYGGGALEPEFRSVPGAELVNLDRAGKYDVSTLVRMARLLRRRSVDVIQPFLTPATFFGLLPALLIGTPVKIVTERCGIRQVRHLGYHAYRTTEDRLTRFADAVVANSIAGQRLMIERGIPAERVSVIYNGINPDRLQVDPESVSMHRARLGLGSGGQVVGIVASLTLPKDHETFLRAAAMLSARFPDIRYAIIGDGPLRSSLKALVTTLGLRERVVFYGYQRRVADLLAFCDVLVSSSRDNEGCSNAILEGMALGVPVVATDAGGNRELVAPNVTGDLVPVGDAPALAEALARALADPTHRLAVADRARRMVDERFGLARMVADYEALYERLLAAHQTYHAPLRIGIRS